MMFAWCPKWSFKMLKAFSLAYAFLPHPSRNLFWAYESLHWFLKLASWLISYIMVIRIEWYSIESKWRQCSQCDSLFFIDRTHLAANNFLTSILLLRRNSDSPWIHWCTTFVVDYYDIFVTMGDNMLFLNAVNKEISSLAFDVKQF